MNKNACENLGSSTVVPAIPSLQADHLVLLRYLDLKLAYYYDVVDVCIYYSKIYIRDELLGQIQKMKSLPFETAS